MAGNFDSRVTPAIAAVVGPMPGQTIMSAFKAQMILQPVFQTMFGANGERIFIDEMPNLNESILPGILLRWGPDQSNTLDAYFEGSVLLSIFLPDKMDGDFNGLRQVANMVQRWMIGPMNLFPLVPGLTKFGIGASFNYDKTASQNGFACPVIEATLPFTIDMQQFVIQQDAFDFTRNLDDASVPELESISLKITNKDGTETLIEQEVLSEND